MRINDNVNLLQPISPHQYIPRVLFDLESAQESLSTLQQLLEEKLISSQQAIKRLGDILGNLSAATIVDFREQFCKDNQKLWDLTQKLLCEIATCILMEQPQEENLIPYGEMEPKPTREGLLRAAEFLSHYVYQKDDNKMAFFLPQGELYFAYELLGSKLPSFGERGADQNKSNCLRTFSSSASFFN